MLMDRVFELINICYFEKIVSTVFSGKMVQRMCFLGGDLGQLLDLVSTCFRENVVCHMQNWVHFLCSLDNLLQKNVIVFLFANQISKWRSFEKRAIFDLFSIFFSHQGKVTKIPSAYIALTTYIYFAQPIDFFALPILKQIRIYQVWFLFGVIPDVDSYSRHFRTINK